MLGRKFLFALLPFWFSILIFISGWPQAYAESNNQLQTSQQQRYLAMYFAMLDGQRLQKEEKYPDALNRFQDCLKQLQSIESDDPSWERAMVQARKKDLQAWIGHLQDYIHDHPEVLNPPTPPPITPDTNAASVPLDPEIDPVKLHERINDLQSKVQDLSTQLQQSQTQVSTLKEQLVSVNTQLDDLRQQPLDDKANQLMTENEDMKSRLSRDEDLIKALQSGSTDTQVTVLRNQLQIVQQQLTESLTANAGWKQNNSALQQELAQVKKTLADAQALEANAANPGPTDEQTRHENEVLRNYITRLTQEESRREVARQLVEEEMKNLKITSMVMSDNLKILSSPMVPLTDEIKAALQNPAPQPIAVNSNATDPSSASSTALTDTKAPNSTTEISTTNNTPASDANTNPVATPTPSPAPDASSANAPSATNQVATTTHTAVDTTSTTPGSNAEQNPPVDNSLTKSTLPEAQTTVTDQTVTSGQATDPTDTVGKAHDADPTQFSTTLQLPADMTVYAQKAADLFNNGRYDEAAAQYQLIIDKYPESLYAWSNLGVVRFQQHNYPESMRALQQAIKLNPNDAMSHRNLGIVYYELNRWESAIDELNRSIALDPTDAFAYNYLGSACASKGWTEMAEKNFLKAIELRDNLSDAYANLALLYSAVHPAQLDKAETNYKKALSLGCPKIDRLEKLFNASDVQ